MKERLGFVSNSSSSSFVIRKTDTMDREKIDLILEKLVELYNITNGTSICVSDICYINETDDIDEIGLRGWNYGNEKKLTLKQFKLMNEHAEPIPGFEIESTYDNPIPGGIQSFLDDVGTRYHWG